MSILARGVAVVLLLTLPLTASAHGFGRATARAAYYVAPSVAVPVAIPALPPVYDAPTPACPGPMAPVYAVPRPAPPSPMPPASAGPGVSESRSFYGGSEMTAPAPERPALDPATASFWNLSDRDRVLKISGQALLLAPGQNVRLSVAREFIWQLDDHEPQVERVPDQVPGVEIVVRR